MLTFPSEIINKILDLLSLPDLFLCLHVSQVFRATAIRLARRNYGLELSPTIEMPGELSFCFSTQLRGALVALVLNPTGNIVHRIRTPLLQLFKVPNPLAVVQSRYCIEELMHFRHPNEYLYEGSVYKAIRTLVGDLLYARGRCNAFSVASYLLIGEAISDIQLNLHSTRPLPYFGQNISLIMKTQRLQQLMRIFLMMDNSNEIRRICNLLVHEAKNQYLSNGFILDISGELESWRERCYNWSTAWECTVCSRWKIHAIERKWTCGCCSRMLCCDCKSRSGSRRCARCKKNICSRCWGNNNERFRRCSLCGKLVCGECREDVVVVAGIYERTQCHFCAHVSRTLLKQ